MTKKEKDECKNKISKLSDVELENNLLKLDSRIKELEFKRAACIAEIQIRSSRNGGNVNR